MSPYYLLPNLSVIRTKTRKTLRDLWKHLKRPENQAPVSSRVGHGSGLGARAGSASPPPGAASSLPGRSRVGRLPGSFNLGAGHPPSSAGSGPPPRGCRAARHTTRTPGASSIQRCRPPGDGPCAWRAGSLFRDSPPPGRPAATATICRGANSGPPISPHSPPGRSPGVVGRYPPRAPPGRRRPPTASPPGRGAGRGWVGRAFGQVLVPGSHFGRF